MQRDLRVCFLGDSFVAGAGDPEHLGWVGRLAAATHAAGHPLTAYNLGVRGDTSLEVLARSRVECPPRWFPGADDRVVVSFGVNDTAATAGAPEAAAAAVRNLDVLLDELLDSGAGLLVVGPPPVADPGHTRRVAALSRSLALLCAGSGVGYVEVVDALAADRRWTDGVRDGDGSHPGAEGYRAVAEIVMPKWWAWLGVG